MTTLREALVGACTRMERARDILTDSNPRPECNWGLLDTKALRAALAQPDEQDLEIERLRAFARDVMQAWPEGDLDGSDLQDAAVKHGLLTPEQRFEPCGEDGACSCAGLVEHADWVEGVECFRRAEWLKDTPT